MAAKLRRRRPAGRAAPAYRRTGAPQRVGGGSGRAVPADAHAGGPGSVLQAATRRQIRPDGEGGEALRVGRRELVAGHWCCSSAHQTSWAELGQPDALGADGSSRRWKSCDGNAVSSTYLDTRPEQAAVFNDAMTTHQRRMARTNLVVLAITTSPVSRSSPTSAAVTATLLCAILRRLPHGPRHPLRPALGGRGQPTRL